jgi:cell division inhibitor SulA
MLTSQSLVQYISRVGYLAIYESNQSDHRGMFMDISETRLDTKVILSRPTKSYIGSKSKQDIIYQYNQYIHKQFLIHRIYERADEIKKETEQGTATAELIKKFNILDQQVSEIILAAERHQCSKQQESKWYIAITHQAQLYKYWGTVVKLVRNKIDTHQQANDLFQQLSEEMQQEILQITQYHHPMITRRECYCQLRLATKYQTQLLKIHRELRPQGLLCLKEIRASEGNMTGEEIIWRIVRQELHNDDLAIVRARRNPKGTPPLSKQELYLKQWQTINPAFHTTTRSSLNTIDVPYLDENSQRTDDPEKALIWSTIYDPVLIEEKLLARNIAHFGQAEGTLFTTQRFQQMFGYSGTTPTASKFRQTTRRCNTSYPP